MSRESRADRAYRRGLRLHRKRRIGEALRSYRRSLYLSPPREPEPALRDAVLRLAPVVHVATDEPLPLRDAVAIYSPSRRVVAYHFFYEDDLDFPNDCEPCDHEVMWVALSEQATAREVSCYFHGRIVRSTASTAEDDRPHVVAQWGKHGTLPIDWQEDAKLVEAMRRTWERLHTEGARDRDSPLARSWPDYYEGSWDDWRTPAAVVDTRTFLSRDGMIWVGERASAILDFYCIPYNFAVKYAWPDRAY